MFVYLCTPVITLSKVSAALLLETYLPTQVLWLASVVQKVLMSSENRFKYSYKQPWETAEKQSIIDGIECSPLTLREAEIEKKFR